jgi:acyl-CoA thioester hydrolase
MVECLREEYAMAETKPVIVPIQIRWRDLDALGHVNNAVYLSYFELARIAYLNAVLPAGSETDPATWLPRDFQFILAEAQIRYRSPAVLTDRLQIAIHVSHVGRKSFIFDYTIMDQNSGRLIAEGCSTQVWYDYATKCSQPIPEPAINAIEALQGAPVARS